MRPPGPGQHGLGGIVLAEGEEVGRARRRRFHQLVIVGARHGNGAKTFEVRVDELRIEQAEGTVQAQIRVR